MLQVACLNEDTDGGCKRIFKPWEERMDFSGEPLRSCDGDPELLLHIPFDGAVKVRAIAIIGGSPETAPATARLCVPLLSLLPPVKCWVVYWVYSS